MARMGFCRSMVVAGLLGGATHAPALEAPKLFFDALANENFKQRESAQANLLAWAREHRAVALDGVWRQYRTSPDPEVRQRCQAVLRDLVTDQYMAEGPGFLGVGMNTANLVPPGEAELTHAVLVTMVKQWTPASRAGVQVGDMIVRLDGKGWVDESSPNQFSEQIAAKKPGATVKLGIVRDAKWIEIDAILVRRPANLQLLRFGILGEDEAAEERAAIDAYFKDWLNERILAK